VACLLLLIPYFGAGLSLALYLAPGNEGKNKYGKDPSQIGTPREI
jgi:uncharacterized membrane protein YhaH (DUF805 family)